MILSFDTSNYTTSACLFDENRGIVWENRILLHPPQHQKGLRQSDVVFLHTKNFETILDGIPNVEITAVTASARPRPIDGSYMPCFLVGMNFARSLAKLIGCPFYTYSHQENHIMAALYSGNHMNLLSDKFLAFHISGGTSDILLVSLGESSLEISQVGGSNDLHAGQLVDRIGVMLGLEFPCGKEIEHLSARCTELIKIKPSVNGNFFHFSGFENQAQRLIADGASKEYVAKFALECVLQTIVKVVDNLHFDHGDLPILFAGGVMSNRYISRELSQRFDRIYFSDPFYSSDHALGNAVLCNIFHKI